MSKKTKSIKNKIKWREEQIEKMKLEIIELEKELKLIKDKNGNRK